MNSVHKVMLPAIPVKRHYVLPQSIQLMAAHLCIEPSCETVFDASYQDECPRCGSHATYAITRWLNRKPEVQS